MNAHATTHRRRGLAILFVIALAWCAAPPAQAQGDAAEWKGFEAGYDVVNEGARALRRGDEKNGRALIRRGREMLRDNAKTYPQYGPNWYGLALADFAENRPKDAEKNLRACLDRTPAYGPARVRLLRYLLGAKRDRDALEILGWFDPKLDPFDEQTEHFMAAALMYEDLGRHADAYGCAREAYERDITKWVAQSRRDIRSGVERVLRYDDAIIASYLQTLAVNAWMSGRDDAAEWLAELARVPRSVLPELPFEFTFLDVARRFREGERDEIANEFAERLVVDGEDAERVFAFLDAYATFASRKKPLPRRALYNGGERVWTEYFARTLGDAKREWPKFLSGAFADHCRERSRAVHEDEPGTAANLFELAMRFDPEKRIEPETLLYLAECYHAAQSYGRAIEVLDRAIAMKPSYGYKYRKLRERCERESERSRPRD